MIFFSLFLLGLISWFFSTAAAGGAATILMPVIAFLLGAEMMAPIISTAALIANPTRVYVFKKNIEWQIILYLLPGSIIGATFGAWSLAQANVHVIQIILGIFLITYALKDKLIYKRFSFNMKLSWFFPLGLIISFLSGLIGATGPIQNPFMLNYGITKESIVGTKAINSLIMQLTKLVSYGFFGVLTIEIASYGAALGFGAVFGVILARDHLKKISVHQFRKYTLMIMLICGVILLMKSLL